MIVQFMRERSYLALQRLEQRRQDLQRRRITAGPAQAGWQEVWQDGQAAQAALELRLQEELHKLRKECLKKVDDMQWWPQLSLPGGRGAPCRPSVHEAVATAARRAQA